MSDRDALSEAAMLNEDITTLLSNSELGAWAYDGRCEASFPCRSDVKPEEDAETHSRSGHRQRSKQRSGTPELRLTRSMQHPPELQAPHNPPADQRRTGRSLPVKLEQQGATGEQAALHQGSSGSPGKGAGSSSQAARRRGSKAVGKELDAAAKAEVTSSRLRQSTAGGSTSGESQSHVDLAAVCQDQADAVGGSGENPPPLVHLSLFPMLCLSCCGLLRLVSLANSMFMLWCHKEMVRSCFNYI